MLIKEASSYEEEKDIDDEDIGVDIKDAAIKANLRVDLPKEETMSYKRLIDACIEYAEIVYYQLNSSTLKLDLEKAKKINIKRREVHGSICMMLLGKRWEEVSQDMRDKISNFAVLVGGKEEYFDQF